MGGGQCVYIYRTIYAYVSVRWFVYVCVCVCVHVYMCTYVCSGDGVETSTIWQVYVATPATFYNTIMIYRTVGFTTAIT